MTEQDISFFEQKYIQEKQKQNNIKTESNKIINEINQHVKDRKSVLESVDKERNQVLSDIHKAMKEKDLTTLDTLFERLR